MYKFFFAFLCATSLGLAQAADFSDQSLVPDWGQTAIKALKDSEIINGNADGSLKPLTHINRAEFLKTLIVATDTSLIQTAGTNFSDVSPQDWFFPYVTTAINLGWVQGYPDGTFKPGNSINRAEIAKLMSQAFDIQSSESFQDQNWFDRYIRALAGQSLLPHDTTAARFSAGTQPTRAEVFEQLYRILLQQGRLTTSTEPVDLPTGQTVSTPPSSDEKFLTFEPTPQASTAKLNVSSSTTGQKASVAAGQSNVNLMSLGINSTASAQMNGVQIRRIGNGNATNFSQIWAEYGGQVISEKIAPQSDFIYLKFTTPLALSGNRTITLKANISATAKTGSSSRWVLFLPDWIDTDAQSTIGFFPVGGRDINVK